VAEEGKTPTELAALGPLVDSTSGLPGRALFFDHLQLALSGLDRDRGTVAVLVVDIDDFKVLNDGLGRAAGDEVIGIVARRLLSAMRPSDTVARLDADEFGVVCTGISDVRDAVAVAERLAGAVRAPSSVDGREIFVTISAGVALATSYATSATRLVESAATAVHRAREAGGNRCEVFDDALRERLILRLETESGLRRALELNEFRLHYQPQFEVPTGRVAAVEALIRWEHPTRGLIEPADFIPVAEKTGLIVPIGAWVLRAACRQALDWIGPDHPGGLDLNVNVSARQLEQPDFVEVVRSALEETGFPAARLCLEVTESAVMASVETALTALTAVKELGVRVAIDDFGVGFSSLGQLRDLLPIHQLKVDRSFVSSVATDPRSRAIVSAVLVMSSTLGLTAVAEGVETEEQLDELRALGCDFSQGFLLGRPQLPEGIERVLAAHA